MRNKILLFFIMGVLLVSAGCQAQPLRRDWSMADLVLLDPVDSSQPSTDILAIYLRTLGSDQEIRIDLLDIPLDPTYDLSISITNFGGDHLIDVPASGRPVVQPGDLAGRIRVIRDPWLDYVVVRFSRTSISEPFSLRVSTRNAGQAAIEDETDLVSSGDISAKKRAPVVIAFRDVFNAFSPAQVLRRWDGAHTGPFGGRHGLKHVLDSVETYHVPIVLLDARTPSSLAALDFAGFLPQIKRLQRSGDLLMPDTAYGSPVDTALEFSRNASRGFDLPQSQFIYSAGVEMVRGYEGQFMGLPATSHLAFNAGIRIIPLPDGISLEATQDGPALDVRRRLVGTLFSEDDSDLVVLGGSLPDSSWGDSDMAYPTFAWLAAHPWVWVMDQADLLTFPVTRRYAPPSVKMMPPDTWLERLSAAPMNAITHSAWQMYLLYHTRTDDDQLVALREVYMGQIGILLRAADWAEAPSKLSNCSQDLDLDGEPECILSDEQYFAVVELNGGRLSHLFNWNGSGAHQLIAPTVQFALGLSDVSQWHPESGDAADPGALMGAFMDPDGYFAKYQIHSLEDGVLTISNPDQGITKRFRISNSGLEVICRSDGPFRTLIPLLADPQAFYFGETDVRAISRPGSWTWGPANGGLAEVRSDADLSALGFNVTRISLGLPEDPNHFFPAGHYFPFPFSMVTIEGQGEFRTWIMGR